MDRSIFFFLAPIIVYSFLISAVKTGNLAKLGWPHIFGPSYTISKIAISALTRIQQREFDLDSREDLVVNSVHPGYIKTDMTFNKGPLSVEEGIH